ncbi:MAG: hypothetical protein ACT4TC_25810, partial [Myxococcaceae bacterium]
MRARALLAAVVVTASIPALAQVPYQVAGPQEAPYLALTGGTPIPTGANETIALPFKFTFGAKQYTAMVVSLHGYVTFSGSSAANGNLGIPYTSTSAPPEIIAPWWDTLFRGQSTVIRTQVQGAEPFRRMVIEWRDVLVGSALGTKVTFQVILYESTHLVRLAYAPLVQPSSATGSASVGVMPGLGQGMALLGCTSSFTGSCDTHAFPALSNTSGAVIDVFYPPDLSLDSIRAEDTGYAGVLYRFSAQLKNGGGRTTLRSKVRFYLSSDPYWDATDDVLGDTDPVDVPALGQAIASGSGAIPAKKSAAS